MLLSCNVFGCQEQGFCARNLQRRAGELKRLNAFTKADYSNVMWPLVHPQPEHIEQTARKRECRFLFPAKPICSAAPIIDAKSPMMVLGMSLSDDILAHIMSFLDKHTLLSFASCTKSLGSYVTKSMVVKAAMSAGGNAKISINEICRLEENASIYPPSPMRLLRLVNGKRCEICLQHSVSHVRVDFGNFVCWQCIVFGGVTRRFNKSDRVFSAVSNVWESILNHDRVANKAYEWRRVYGSTAKIHFERSRAIALGRPVRFVREFQTQNGEWSNVLQIWDNRVYMWRRPQEDRLGERVGVLVTYNDIYDLAHTMLDSKTAVADSYTASSMFNPNHEKIINAHIVDVIGAPPSDDPRYNKISEARKLYLPRANYLWRLQQRRQSTATCNWRAKKLTNTIKAIEALTERLTHPLARELLLYEINTEFMSQGNKYSPSVLIHNKDAKNILSNYLSRPSTMMRNEVLTKLATKIENLQKNL